MKTTLGAICIACCLAAFVGCEIINPAEPLPAYLVIPSFDLVTDYSSEGSDAEKITEVWVFANDQLIGAYDLPAEVPILVDGVTDIEIYPGIKNNGVATDRIIYPFYSTYQLDLDMRPLEKDTIFPVFGYKESVSVINVDDFENNTVFTVDIGVEGEIVRTTDDAVVFEGDGSGLATLTADEALTRIVTNEQDFDLPGNRLSYLEMNFRSNNSMAVGLLAVSPASTEREYLVILNPTTNDAGEEEWNKVYVDLSTIAATYSTFSDFEVFIESVEDESGKEVELYFDNIKIVHF
ncbi:MAG: hypothetical protein MK081_14910 [Flavobacteriales bacterium]|nr:hypothetical protein [Flavobacteriales bacterium]